MPSAFLRQTAPLYVYIPKMYGKSAGAGTENDRIQDMVFG